MILIKIQIEIWMSEKSRPRKRSGKTSFHLNELICKTFKEAIREEAIRVKYIFDVIYERIVRREKSSMNFGS